MEYQLTKIEVYPNFLEKEKNKEHLSYPLKEKQLNRYDILFPKLLMICFSLILVTFFLFFQFSKSFKDYIYLYFLNLHENGITGFLTLIFIGSLMILIAFPFIIFELYIPFILQNFYESIIIVFSAKILGVSLSFLISRKIFKKQLEAILKQNKNFKIIERIFEDNQTTSLILISILFIPFFIKNYGLPLLKISYKVLLLIYINSQLLFSIWYIYIGINAREFIELEDNNMKKISFYILIFISLILLLSLLVFSKKIIRKYSINIQSDFVSIHSTDKE